MKAQINLKITTTDTARNFSSLDLTNPGDGSKQTATLFSPKIAKYCPSGLISNWCIVKSSPGMLRT